MPPKKPPLEEIPPKKPLLEEAPSTCSSFIDDDFAGLHWVYGVNDHLDCPTKLPADFVPTGAVSCDFRSLCQVIGAVVHPAFKERKCPEKPAVRSRRPSLIPAPVSEAEPEQPKELHMLSVRSILLDCMAMTLLRLLLPFATRLKVLCFSDCRLDSDMLRLLRAGLVKDCSVESLQIEWNAFELPLPSLEEASRALASGRPHEAPGDASHAEEGMGRAEELELRERYRYLAQSHRHLHCFREYLECRLNGNLEDAWAQLSSDTDDLDALLSASEFHDTLETRLGISGPQVAEVFEVLDGPDYAAGQARVSLRSLWEALDRLPEDKPDHPDPVGLMLASFMDGECVLESVSLRACAIGRLELGPLSEAIAQSPWQLRCLNLWDNRICDRGVELLAAAMTSYRGLEYLGLGKNRLSHVGLACIAKPFQSEALNETRYLELQDQRESASKVASKGKAKAAPKPKPAEPRRDSRRASAHKVAQGSGRVMREPIQIVEEVEEVPGDPPTYLLRRSCELRMLTLSDNPIVGVDVVEALLPHGPRGAELILRGTPVASTLLAKRPDVLSRASRHAAANAIHGGDGWVLRVV